MATSLPEVVCGSVDRHRRLMISGVGLVDRTYAASCSKTACIALPAWGPISHFSCSVALGGWWVRVVVFGGLFEKKKSIMYYVLCIMYYVLCIMYYV